MNKSTLVGPTWFRVAVQALVVIVCSDDACPSSAISEHVESHAAFLRRVLAQLAREGIVEAREGRGGGYRLARNADEITLAEVFEAVKIVGVPDELSPSSCMGARVQSVLDGIGAEVERSVVQLLGNYTVAYVIEQMGAARKQHKLTLDISSV